MPMIMPEKCEGCGICVDTCEQGALMLQDDVVQFIKELCIGCGECVKACPTGALVGKKKKMEA